ncbi:MAG: helicase-exonuclease AddAB subunit AddA [Anaerohalosphaeraceae bacterium]|nr:helicase-exonuclease AddAB subunit AddA [Anaerohalosphaeraceae bacterium]
MSSKKIKWTQSQAAAVDTSAPDITVTASAGTGKTTVLSSRCVRVISEPSLCKDVSEILVLTFTDASAGEMASRISARLKDSLAVRENSHIRRQFLMFDSADVSTIHSFCKRTITEHFYRLGIDPAFRLLDDDEQKLIKSEVLGQVIEAAWAEDALAESMKKLFAGRAITKGKNSFLNTIITISDFLDTTVLRHNFYNRAAALADSSVFTLDMLTAFLRKKFSQIDSMLTHCLQLDSRLADGYWQGIIRQFRLGPVTGAASALEKGDLRKCIMIIRQSEAPTLRGSPDGFDKESVKVVKSLVGDAIGEFESLADFPGINPAYDSVVAPHLPIQIKTLIELVKRFDRAYSSTKSQLGCLDFSDLEHKMLQLLCDSDDFAAAGPSDVALQMRSRYKYIFVDEYQDINPVQQRIIDLVSSQNNIFVVGDVKQSIYAFRGADCELFVQRLRQSQSNGEKIRLDLNENFRSQPGILNFVNSIFARIMTSEIASVDYDDRVALKSGTDSQNSASYPPVELLFIDDKESEVSDDDSKGRSVSTSASRINRGKLIARRIKQLVSDKSFTVRDKATGLQRPVEYRDFAILMRSISNRANDYVQVFAAEGVPVTSASSVGYFETTEISDILSLLRIIDNPQQDIPLAAAMKCPIFDFSQTELATIKAGKDTNLFNGLVDYASTGQDSSLAEKTKAFLSRLDQWRSLARGGSLSDLIWQIYRHSDYLAIVSALPGGNQRRANLLKLHQRAIQFEGFATSSQTISLARFVDFLEKLLAQGGDWSPAEPDSSADNAVKIMSIHKSKGLEFPVVIMAELNAGFNLKSKNAQCLMDSENALGLQIFSPDLSARFASVGWNIISQRIVDTNLAEEMRILYVAMTRACDLLILSGSFDSGKYTHKVASAAICSKGPLPAWLLRKGSCHLDWILYALAGDRKIANFLSLPADFEKSDNDYFSLNLVNSDDVDSFGQSDMIAAETVVKSHSQLLLENIKADIDFDYPSASASRIPAKESVSSLSHYGDEFQVFDYADSFAVKGLAENLPNPAVVGSAYHLLIQKMDISIRPDIESIEKTRLELVESGAILSDVAGEIDSALVEKFFASETGSMVCDSANKVHREWPFTVGIGASHIFPDKKVADDEKIIVQGIIDMLIETSDGLVIVDFKTDRVSGNSAMQRAENYKSQMSYYCRAASEILNQKISAAFLYFLRPSVSVDLSEIV